MIDDTTIKDVTNLFWLKKEIYDTTAKDIRNKNKSTKTRIIRDTRHLSQHEEEDYYKPVRVGNFWSNNHIEYEKNREKKHS